MNRYSYLIFALSLFLAAAIIENGLLNRHPEKSLIKDFVEEFQKNERTLYDRLNKVADLVKEEEFDVNYGGMPGYLAQTLEEEGIGILVFFNDSLVYWSDRSIAFYDDLSDFPRDEGLVQLPNGYYLVEHTQSNSFQIYGFHLIKHQYQHENEFLVNSFFEDYRLPDDYQLKRGNPNDLFPVYSLNEEYLFSIVPKGFFLCTRGQLYFPGVLYLLGLLFLLVYFNREFIFSRATFLIKVSSLALALFLVYWLHLMFNIPKVFSLMRFFSPSVFALSDWLPSLGDFFLLSLFFLFWMFHFGKYLDAKDIQKDSFLPRKVVGILLLLFSAATYLLIHFYIHKLVFNSTISFSLNRIIDISYQSVLAIFSAGLLLLAVFILTVRIVDHFRNDFHFFHIFLAAVAIALFLAGMQYISYQKVSVEALMLFVVATLLAVMFSKNYLQKFTLSYLIIFVSASSIYSLVVFYTTTAEQQRNIQKLMAVNLVAERDPAAEVFLDEIQDSINVDPNIPLLLIEENGLAEYLDEKYFSGYFRQYDLRILICSGGDSLLIEADDQMAPCIDFFEDMIETQGMQIPGTRFYFMDNMNGRISYTGWLHYHLASEEKGISIFIELDSELLFEGIGFPELLIDKSMIKPESYKQFDYAKYYGGELTDKHGDYNYNLYVHTYLTSNKEFEFNRWDGMEHLIYHTRENNYVIVSRELFTFIDYLISFPYLFVFYFLSVLILLVIANPSIRKRSVKFDLKFRIQAAIIS
ncbi:MAG: hypothetical protein ACOC2E_08945, partial [Bacteroidota bacterium]